LGSIASDLFMALALWTEFFDDLQLVRGRSRNTVMAYRRDLELYDEYRKHKDSISGFFVFMRERKLSERSQARIISSLRTYFKFAEEKGRPSPELRELHPPKIKAKLPQALTENEFRQLLEHCHSGGSETLDAYRTSRNQITLYLLFGLGCRVTELIGLSLEDIDLTSGVIKVLGKGSKERLIPLTEFLIHEVRTYLEHVRPHLVKDATDALLVNERGHRPSRIDIWRWLAAWSKRAGFSEPIHPHRFRHGCATALLESGADLRSIQMLLGHASLQTTQIYTSVSTQKMAEAVERAHPLSKIESET
jgi:integrase/recombinase XerD